MKHTICDACETVAHCTRNGCIPLVSNEPSIDDLEHENRLLRARNERLEAELQAALSRTAAPAPKDVQDIMDLVTVSNLPAYEAVQEAATAFVRDHALREISLFGQLQEALENIAILEQERDDLLEAVAMLKKIGLTCREQPWFKGGYDSIVSQMAERIAALEAKAPPVVAPLTLE